MTVEELIKEKTQWGIDNGYSVDEKRMAIICKSLVEKTEGVCPCKVFRVKKEGKEHLICPCSEMAEEVKMHGKCTCGIYLKGTNGENNKL